MLRISKLADYAIIVSSFLAKSPNDQFSAAVIAAKTKIAVPTVSKLLKRLNDAQVLHSTRGTLGGYRLARSPELISIATVITVMDGKPAITECSQGNNVCSHDQTCNLRDNWRLINKVIFDVLDSITLADMHRGFDITQFSKKTNQLEVS